MISRHYSIYLNVGLGVYLVYSIPWGSARQVVKVVALNKHTLFTHAADPHLSTILLIQNHPYMVRKKGGREWEERGRRKRGRGREGGWKEGEGEWRKGRPERGGERRLESRVERSDLQP